MLSVDCIYEHRDFLIVNKPIDVPVHAHNKLTLLEYLRQNHNNPDIHPCHRLDMATSGLMIFAKSSASNQFFSQAFAQHKIQKMYLALTTGKPKKKQGWIVGDMTKARNGSYKLLKSQHQPAKTYGISFGYVEKPRLWLLRPLSGKTHQLRVALKSLGTPIIGDKRYGAEAMDRLYLHAYSLRFSYHDEAFEFYALPAEGEYFSDIDVRLDEIGNPWAQAWPKGVVGTLG